MQLSTGELREAEVVGYDRSTDIALIKIPPGRLFPAVRATSQEPDDIELVRQGDLVFAFGSPFDFRFSMSSGVVSGIGRSVERVDCGGADPRIWIVQQVGDRRPGKVEPFRRDASHGP